MNAQTELAWAAGFFDGEGCVTSFNDRHPPFRKRVQLIVGQSGTTEHLERFARAVGCGNISGPYRSVGRENRADRYAWQVSGRKAMRVMELLRPYLCTPKLAKLEAVVALYEPEARCAA